MNTFKKNGISTDSFRPVKHRSDCVYLNENTCLTREYPEGWFEDIVYFTKIQAENFVRKFLSLLGVSQGAERPVPEDEANFFLDNTSN